MIKWNKSAATYGINAPGSKDGGHAWSDYDRDGDLDLIVNTSSTGSTNGSKLYRNDGGSFTDVTASLAPNLDDQVRERQAIWEI